MEPAVFEKALAYAKPVYEFALTWLLSPAAWSQFVILLFAYFLAVILTRKFNPVIAALLAPADEATGPIAKTRRFVLRFMPLILPLLAYALTGVGESVTRSVFGSGAVIAFGKRVFLFLAIRTFARTMLHDPMLKFLGKFVLIPVGALYALGLIEFVASQLKATVVPLGNLSFDLLWLVQFIVVGSIIFWFGRWSNDQSSGFISKQEEMRPATRQLASKAAEIVIFGAAFLANDQDGSADELRAVLTDAVAVMEDAVAAAPNDQAEAAQTIRDAYRSLQSALNDVDYVVAELDATDERLAPLADPALSAAIVSVNEACL